MSRRLYVSDVHLEPGQSERLAAFEHLLRRHQQQVDDIYVLGDLCEMWIGDDDDSTLVDALATLFQEVSSHCTVSFLPGNRDFLLGEDFAARCGLRRLEEPCQIDAETLVVHGDAQCTDDQPYQDMRALLRSADWQQTMLAKSLNERRAFGEALRARSRQENANKPGNIMDVNPTAIQALLGTAETRVIIHGHTHRPAHHRLGADRHRIVLGAWERCGWWAIQEPGAVPTLHCAALSQLAAALS